MSFWGKKKEEKKPEEPKKPEVPKTPIEPAKAPTGSSPSADKTPKDVPKVVLKPAESIKISTEAPKINIPKPTDMGKSVTPSDASKSISASKSAENQKVTEKPKKGSGIKDGTMVIIKPKAYIAMKKHVLRFGSNVKSRDEYREVMGMLMGTVKDGKNPNIKDVIIEDAIPVSHGGKVEVAFAPEDYVNFSILDSQFAEKGIFNVGWYHSHPGLSCFFSAVDIRNQLGFQSANAAAIGLVFDHERFKNPDDMGFDAYRLDNPGQGQMSDYHEVDWMVEAPENFEFYTDAIKNLIDAYHKGEPAILELSEVPDVFGDLSMPGRNSMMAKQPELNYAVFADQLSKGVAEFANAFFQPMFKYLNDWASSMSTGLIDKNIQILEILTELKKNLSESIGGLQSWFKFQINDRLRDIDILVDDQIELMTGKQKDTLDKIDGLSTSIKNQIATAFAKALGQTITKITEDLNSTLSKFKVAMESGDALLTTIGNQQTIVSQAIDEYNKQTAQLKKGTEGLMNSLEMTLNTNLGATAKDLDEIVSLQKDLLDSLKALKSLVNQL